MPVRIENNGELLTARLEGEIDHHTARDMRESIDDAIERHRPNRVVLDFSQVGFMDSSGIGLIMGRYRLLSEHGAQLEIGSTPANLLKMMRLAGLSRLGIKGVEQR